jgi:signal transduction histidine kinase/ActR/RegA family two-component response regulator
LVPDEPLSLEREAAAHAPCGLLTFSDDGTIRYANDCLHRWLEKAPGSLLNTRLDAVLSPASRVFHSTHFFPLLKLHGVADEIYLTLRTASGTDLPVLVNGVRETRGDSPLNHCGLVTMHRRKEFEAALVEARRAAEAATTAKDEFLAVVSHELRAPLSAISGWIHLARSGKLDATMMHRALETIERNAQTQAQLIEDLLDVSRIISGKMRISPKPLDLAPVLERAVETARPSANAKQIMLSAALDHHAGIVHADPTRMQQIVWNLVSNAIKFTPKGGRVEVVLSRVGSHARIAVADTGVGISAEQLPYVFERFWQASPGGRREASGLGIGLSICRSLVELQGGSIRADSAGAGKGSVFIAEFPLAIAFGPDAGAGAHDTDAEVLAGTSLAAVRVMVVDDDAGSRELLRMLLQSAGATVDTAASADEALARMRAERPDVLISDVGMPGKDGYALVRALRADPGIGRNAIAAIAVTGYARPQDRVRILRAGFQAHLAKPVEPDEVLALVRALAGSAGSGST